MLTPHFYAQTPTIARLGIPLDLQMSCPVACPPQAADPDHVVRVANDPTTEHNRSMVDDAWTDDAVRSGNKDTLGRLSYARRAAELISSTHSSESSVVFGLSGPWGSGKTSLVNMIVEALVEAHPEWAIARFTPWATSDITGLLGEFYASLAEALPKQKGQQIRKAFALTASVAAPTAKLIPYLGEAATEAVRVAGDALAKSPSWQVAFSKASKKLKELKKPILVVVDDIDRLHADELMALLKVVRLLGRFDGVQYLLAYDDETLYRSMSASSAVNPHDGSAERFMEKIVQYPLFVPPMLRHQQLARLNAGLAGILREDPHGGASERRLSGLADCFVALLTTPRAIDRYLAQLRHHIPLLPPDEVDDEDVQLLTLIRVSFPALFNAIPHYRSELISGHTGEIKPGQNQIAYESFDIEPLLAVVPSDARRVARRLLVSLFPKVRAEGQLLIYGSHRRQSVQNEEYFDRYFAMGILDPDISDSTVAAAVQAAGRGDMAPLTGLLVETTGDLRGLVLSKATNPTHQPSTDAGRTELAEGLADIANQLSSDDTGPFSGQDQVLMWVADLLVALDKETPAETYLRVIGRLSSMALRIRAWRRIENALKKVHHGDPPTWYDQATVELVRNATADFLDHLRLGDDAPAGRGVGYQVHFVLRHDPKGLQDGVLKLLTSQQADLSLLASRLVSARTVAGIEPDWKLSTDFNQEAFNQIAPPGDDPWYEQPIQQVDLRDLSWANRRKFVAGRVNPPPAPLSGPDEASPADTSD